MRVEMPFAYFNRILRLRRFRRGTSPIDRRVFAHACVHFGTKYGVDAHYLLAAALLRSEIRDGAFGDRFGPYQYTQSRWDRDIARYQTWYEEVVSSKPPDLKALGIDIGSWVGQCNLFAFTTNLFASNLLKNLDRPPEPAELYLSDIVGVEMVTAGAELPDYSLEAVFSQRSAAAALSELRAVVPHAATEINWQAVVNKTAAELQGAYNQTDNLITTARRQRRPMPLTLGPEKSAPPPPIAISSRELAKYADDEQHHHNCVEFLFATDRKRTRPPIPDTRAGLDNLFGFERARSLTFGSMCVNVPEDPNHKIGRLELPWEFRLGTLRLYREDVNPRRHFFIKGTEVFNQRRFARIARSDPSHTAIVFVHGFNTTFSQAALRFAQIVWDMQFKGTSVLYSWPSHGGILNYLYDRDSVSHLR